MKWTGVVFLALLDSCVAQKWKLVGCDKFNANGEVTAAMTQAIAFSGTAIEVLNNNLNDPKVQSMVKHILGDGAVQQTNVDKIKVMFGNVQKYEKQESQEPIANFNRNTDLLIFCDYSNYETINGRVFNKAQGLPALEDDAIDAHKCFFSPETDRPPMAQTMIPLEFTPDYRVRHQQWAEQRDKGVNAPMPDMKGFSVNHPDKPTTMDLCTWLMDLVAGGEVFSTLTDHAIAQAQSAAFINNLNTLPGGSGSGSGTVGGAVIKPIDVLSGESVSGLLLHELTHTTLGGETEDVFHTNGCYGWDCVGTLQNPNNADTIAILGICMGLFKKGFWVDNSGDVLKI